VSAATTGTYANIVAFQRSGNTTDFSVCCNNNAVATFGGAIYAPTANVNFHNGTITAQAIIAESISWSAGGNGSTTIGQTPPPLSITGPSSIPSPWTRSVAYPSTTIFATGGTGTYTWSAAGLPAGMTINAATGAITGTPTGAANTYNVTVTVTDAFNTTATKSYTIVLNGTLAITGPASLPNWTKGKAFTPVTVTTSGGTAPLSFSAPSLPPGLSINAGTGVISGTPTTPGTYSSFSVTVTDSVGASANRTYSMTINPAITITGPASLPNGQQGVAYPTQTLTSTGGTGAITWSQAGLPAGLSLNAATGAITGTPTAVGSFTVNVTATDTVGATATTSYSFNVSVVPFNVTSVTLGNGGGAGGLGQVAQSDTVTVQFNKAIAVASMCSTWSGNGTNQSLQANNDVTVTITNGVGAVHDSLTVSSATCALHFGTLDLGTSAWVTSTTSYTGKNANKSTITYDATTFQLVITLGAGGAGASGVPAQTVSLARDLALTDTFANTLAAASYTSNNQRF
jgi:hypothetical protein